MTDKTVLSSHGVSLMLGIHRNTLQRMSAKELPYFRVCDRGDRRYFLADVQKYIEARMVR